MVNLSHIRFPLQTSINRVAVDRSKDTLWVKGLKLPCIIKSVSANTVKVQISVKNMDSNMYEVPCARSAYERPPYQVGDRGVVMCMDVDISEMTGAGSSVPSMATIGNLGALVFFPVSTTKGKAPDDLNMYYISGPNGFLLTSVDGSVSVSGEKGKSLALKYGSSGITITDDKIDMTGTLVINGQVYTQHTHTNGNNGSPTGPVIA